MRADSVTESPPLVLHRPDVIQELHESMVRAGAEVVETDTFQASRLKLEEWGLGEHTFEINQKAAEIAKQAYKEGRPILDVADEHTDLGRARLAELLDPEKLTGEAG